MPTDPSDNPLSTPFFPVPRRTFFQDLFTDALSPLSNMVNARIHPLIDAFNALPDEVKQAGTRKSKPLPQLRSLLPPGATPQFATLCTRCGDCVSACPANAIEVDPSGLRADGLPHIIPAESPCVICASLACMQSCATGALAPVDRAAIKIGRAKVDHAICLRGSGEACTLCVDVCPVGEAAIVVSPITGRIRVHSDACTGCGMCEQRCPTNPRAVTIYPLDPDREPIIA